MNVAESIIMIGCGLLFMLAMLLLSPLITGYDGLEITFAVLAILFFLTTGFLFFRLAWRLIFRGR
ncbi:MAG: hypothetical protein IJB64_10195 [Akkermansia sp.]|nr:hypothetical protein [Akkermansia sp.]MBQ4636789.1 hypothetical protein [Akkermansia sp.]